MRGLRVGIILCRGWLLLIEIQVSLGCKTKLSLHDYICEIFLRGKGNVVEVCYKYSIVFLSLVSGV